MDSKGSNSIRNFFLCMGGGFVVLCVKAKFITGSTILVVKSLWYTFLYNFTVAIWIGLAGMFMIDIYSQLKQINMIQFWDYVNDKFSAHSNTMIVSGGVLGGILTSVFLFDGTWAGAIKSMEAIGGAFITLIVGLFAKDVYKWGKDKTLKFIKTKPYVKKRRNKAA